MLLNSNDVQSKRAAAGSRAEKLVQDPRPDPQKVTDLFWAAFARAPSSGEMEAAMAHLSANSSNKRVAFEDILWALVNAKEFQFND